MIRSKASPFVLAPSVLAVLVFVYAFIAWSVYLSFTDSTLVPRYTLTGFGQYARLWTNTRWLVAAKNFVYFGVPFVGLCLAIGVGLAVLVDQAGRAEAFFRTVFLYPMALSFIVTGTAWKWLLNPELGPKALDWMLTDRPVLAVLLAAVWQASGFVMAIFLAGLRGADGDLVKAALVDGAGKWALYRRVLLPSLLPLFFSAGIVLVHTAVKTFDLVLALTGGGPGFSSDLPALFMYAHAFQRNQLGLAAASAVTLLVVVFVVTLPYVRKQLR